MRLARYCQRFIPFVLLLGLALPAFAAPLPTLATPPEGGRWFNISMDGERVGFAHMKIGKTDEGYRIESQASIKLHLMGFSRESTVRESYLVGPDLVLRSFATDSQVNGRRLLLQGEVTPKGIRVTQESGGRKKERLLKSKGPVYPSLALNVYPLMHGAQAGKRYKIAMLDPDSGDLTQVKVEVVGAETLPSGTAVLHLKNSLYPVDNDIWVDFKGNSLKESVRDDLIVTLPEDEASARLYLTSAALAKRDPVLDFSLIRVASPLPPPEQLQKLSVEFTGIPAALPLLQGKGQAAARLPDGRVLFTMPNPAFVTPAAETPAAAYLQPAEGIPSGNPEIVARMAAIVGAEKDPVPAARRLMVWVTKEIKGAVNDSQSPLATLKSRSGNSESHARLYTALARAAGIPTRLALGLVYAKGQGFLYHGWAESYLDGWVTVDPTYGELPADRTHIKLTEGDAEGVGYLADMIGRVQAKVIEAK